MGTATDRFSARVAWAGLAAACAGAWLTSPMLSALPHLLLAWFLVPVLWAALHQRTWVALVLALVSGGLAALVAIGDALLTSHSLAEWAANALFLMLIALLVAAMASRLRWNAFRDPLTGLVNRAAMTPSLHAAVARARRDGQAIGLVYLDLDDFKVVNDSLGHACGDELLRQVAARLDAAKRAGDVLARHGGDEFIVLLDGLGGAGSEDVERRAGAAVERLVAALQAPIEVAGSALRVECSAGLSLFPADAPDADALHDHADAAMYSAKSRRSGWARYVPSDSDPLVRISRGARLRAAVETGALELHYQPIFVVGGGIKGVEALVRWCDGEHGPVPPSEFIPLAEETGVIDALGDWVIREMCRQVRAWQAEGLYPHYGVNVAPRQLRQPRFAERLIALFDEEGIDAGDCVIELTESAWTLEESRTLPVLTALREAGFALAIDDFGAGYSSLSRIHDLPLDVIKVDRAFLQGVPENAQSVAIMSAIFQLAAACGTDVVVEGVETAEQYRFLAERGFRHAQGYALARPATASVVTQLLRDNLVESRRRGVAARPVAA